MKRLIPLLLLMSGHVCATTTIPLSSIRQLPTDIFSVGKLNLNAISGIAATMNGGRITGLGDPVNAQDATTKAWVQAFGGTPALTGVLNSVLAESPLGTKAWIPLTADMILPGFAIASFNTSATTNLEIGDTIASPVTFTASYVSPASSGSITDGSHTTVLTSPYTSGTLAFSYSKTAPNATQTFTLNAAAATNKSASITAIWRARIYYGIATPGTINTAFVTSLASNFLASGVGGTYSIGAGNNTMKAYLCLPSSLGQPSSFKDGGGFAVPTSQVGTPTVVNSFSVSTSYTCYGSDNFLNSAFSWVVN